MPKNVPRSRPGHNDIRSYSYRHSRGGILVHKAPRIFHITLSKRQDCPSCRSSRCKKQKPFQSKCLRISHAPRRLHYEGAMSISAASRYIFSSSSCDVRSVRMSDMGHACFSMPCLKGRIMFLTARVVMQVCENGVSNWILE